MKIVIKDEGINVRTSKIDVALNVLMSLDLPEVQVLKDKIAFEQLSKIQAEQAVADKAAEGIIKKAQDSFEMPNFAPVDKKNEKKVKKPRKVTVKNKGNYNKANLWTDDETRKFIKMVLSDDATPQELVKVFPNRTHSSLSVKRSSVKAYVEGKSSRHLAGNFKKLVDEYRIEKVRDMEQSQN